MNVIDAIEATLPQVQTMGASGVRLAPSRISEEIAFWQNGALKESDPTAYQRLQKYWNNVGVSHWTPSGTAWSGAFISYILRQSGFPGSGLHSAYAEAIAAGNAPGWVAYSIPKNQGRFKLQPGDVLVAPRGGSGALGHGDVVWQVQGGQALLVGGNMGHSVKVSRQIPIDAQGFPTSSISDYKIILKKKDKTLKWYALAALVIVLVWRER